MAHIPAFQASDESSILSARTNKKPYLACGFLLYSIGFSFLWTEFGIITEYKKQPVRPGSSVDRAEDF